MSYFQIVIYEVNVENKERIIDKYSFREEKKYLVGRSEDKCDILIKNEKISRTHAELSYSYKSKKFIIKDLGSANGTFVNDKLLEKQIETEFTKEDKIKFGETNIYLIIKEKKVKDSIKNDSHHHHFHKNKRKNSRNSYSLSDDDYHYKSRKYKHHRKYSSDSDYSNPHRKNFSNSSNKVYRKNTKNLRYKDKQEIDSDDENSKKSRSRSRSRDKDLISKDFKSINSLPLNIKMKSLIVFKNKDEDDIDNNLRQIKLYNEYLQTKEVDIKTEKLAKLPKLTPI